MASGPSGAQRMWDLDVVTEQDRGDAAGDVGDCACRLTTAATPAYGDLCSCVADGQATGSCAHDDRSSFRAARTIPLFFLRDGDDLIVCNVRPPSERSNPWCSTYGRTRAYPCRWAV
jgi:hypothetical protein